MNRRTIMVAVGVVLIAVASIAYGALTTPTPQQQSTPVVDLSAKLTAEMPTITGVLNATYPAIGGQYHVSKAALYGSGEWFGAVLLYKGSDTANRDTLRLLMQKKDGVWVVRSTPPTPLLSTKSYPDAPRDILIAINKPVSLP